ncbi:MAG: DUF1501 domain-containing protein [Planctomycetaceae bacterium]|nr:DUF1501 domain-containing protein [Planctomycetaceae bacterium]
MTIDPACHSPDHYSRRTILRAAGLSGMCWLTPLAERLARAADRSPQGAPAKSVIVLYMEGGPSQLETFDPHPGREISHAVTKAIKTRAPDVLISNWLPQIAEHMDRISLVRAVVSKEGDHERAAYNIKTGFRPDPTLVHPSLGAIVCHQTKDNVEIPRHVAILPGPWAPRGGYLGDQFDAFKTFDPSGPIPDVTAPVHKMRAAKRLDDLQNVVETEFARRRLKGLDAKTLHATSIAAARKMMSSDQLKAFNVSSATDSVKKEFGDTPFGRSCLAAVQLIEVGVRCVEVTLSGWDTHADNESLVQGRCEVLDPAFAALIEQLQERNLLDATIVLWGGEFGRTPTVNAVGGRDHWPQGFTIALAGGGIQGGRVLGETSPTPKLNENKPLEDIRDHCYVEDIHATVLHALGIDFAQEVITPIGRPMALSKGKVLEKLLA